MKYRTSIIMLGLMLSLLRSVSGHEGHENPVISPVNDDPSLPRVLLLGDSISMGYTLEVRRQLHGRANVHRALENCGPTTNGLAKLQTWLGDRRWDVIHFNFGLHDLKHVSGDGKLVDVADGNIQVPLPLYRQHMTGLVRQLMKTNATLVWCATTPVPEGAKGRIAGDEREYNRVAREVIDRRGGGKIIFNDLHSFAQPKLAEIQQPANVHFTRDGSKILATEVARVIGDALQLTANEPKMATGFVFHDANGNEVFDPSERPLAGIRVSNGREIVKTDVDGSYRLPVGDDTILFVIKPRGWRTPINAQQLPRFYYNHKPFGSPKLQFAGVAATGPLPASVDFPLYPQQEPDKFQAILFGDPQPRDKQEIDYIAHDVVEELIGTDASFGVTLGDIVFDDLDLFDVQADTIAVLGIPWYNVIGNHDINFDAKNDKQSDETFERHFGPAYYSFDYGPVHFLVLDDVEWLINEEGKGRYEGGLGKEQLEFIRNDLANILKDQLLVVLMHIPLEGVDDRQELYRLIEDRPFCMSVSAHTHYMQHRFITSEDGWNGPQPHHHVINVTVSGSWWSGQKDERGIPHTTMADGAPNGYSIITFDGNRYELDFKAAGRAADYQMNIYAPDELSESNATENCDIYVNVFNGSERTKVELRLDDEPWKLMEHVRAEDPAFRKMFDTESAMRENLLKQGIPESELWLKITSPEISGHIWFTELAELSERKPGTHVLEVRSTDMHGRTHIGKRTIRIRTAPAIP